MLLKRWWLPLVFASLASSQDGALPSKETLPYQVEWRLITAGKAKLEWSRSPEPASGYQVNLHLESVGLVSKLFKVEDDYSSTLNRAFCAESLHIVSNEGSRKRETKVTFNSETKKASYLERDRVKNTVVSTNEIDIPECVHDVIGGLLYLRTLELEPRQSTQIPVSDGKKSVMAKVEAQQKEEVKTPAGNFKTVRYEVFLFNKVLYRRSAHLYVWLTDDRQKIPVQIRVRMTITIGTITLQLDKSG